MLRARAFGVRESGLLQRAPALLYRLSAPLLAVCVFAATIACALPAGAQTRPTPAPSRPATPSVWCIDVEDPQPPFDQIKQYVTFAHAAQALCAGDATGAATSLAAILPAMKARINDGTWWIDYGRAYFYALIATHDGDAALRWLKDFGAWNPRPNERLFWSGNDAGSFAAYVADDPSVPRSPDEQAAYKGDPRLAAALAALKAGDLPGAEALMQQSVAQYGGSLRLVMLGNLYAQQRNWPQAFAAWLSAANAGSDVIEMEFSTLDTWNVAALEMIYYYRAHAPAR